MNTGVKVNGNRGFVIATAKGLKLAGSRSEEVPPAQAFKSLSKSEARKVRKALHKLGLARIAAVPAGGSPRMQALDQQYTALVNDRAAFLDDPTFEMNGIDRTPTHEEFHDKIMRKLLAILNRASKDRDEVKLQWAHNAVDAEMRYAESVGLEVDEVMI